MTHSQEKPDNNDAQLLARVNTIETKVEKIRKRRFTASPGKGILGPEEIRIYMQKMLNQELPDHRILYMESVYRDFGLLPGDSSLKEILLNLISAQAGGFYDPAEDTFYLARNFAALGEIIIAHELTHALQDCHAPLEKVLALEDLGYKPAARITSDDIALARLSFFEGEAQEVTNRLIAAYGLTLTPGYMNKNDYGQLIASQIQVSLTPAVIANQLMFPYTKGQNFINILAAANGWQPVNDAYKNLPVSTEQIIHPDKYVNNEQPQIIDLNSLTPLQEDGWQLIGQSTLGEFMIDEIVRTNTNCFVKGIRAGSGWGGDAIAVYGREKEILTIWYTVWDSIADQKEFRLYMQEGLDSIALRSAPESDSNSCRILSHTPHGLVYISAPDTIIQQQALALARTSKIYTWNNFYQKRSINKGDDDEQP